MRRYEAPNSRTAASCVNRFIHSAGAIAVVSPMPPVMAATMAAPSQATRKARFALPAPMLVATIAVSAVPKPKAMGTRMYSSRAATPYPASAAVPKLPTKAVATAIDALLTIGLIDAGTPTRRMSRTSGACSRQGDRFKAAAASRRSRCAASSSAAAPLAMSRLIAAPGTPRPGIGPQPNTSVGHSTRWISAVSTSSSAGSSILPSPRTTAPSTLVAQMTMAPPNSTLE